ncbi:MAG TPA: molybdopterin-dependent oxidoreductase [Candidatus Saccharimonadales bacterium]|jgi:anaerobic selenocysteine-containing dehydrogenase|nr:molybdopterin-dependent oxidoreductase [Candidatus Saccharimonadales bacterium]
MKKVVRAACPHDCPDACGVLITVEDGRATRIQGDPAHPVTRGFLCAKVAKYLDRVYSPDRVLYPMRRIAPKGQGKGDATDFTRITWDEALDEIAARFKGISDEFGPEAILPYSYAGNMAVIGFGGMGHRFFHRLGASQLNRTICASTGGEALMTVLGRRVGTEPEQFTRSKYIIAWGANIHGNNIHLWPFIEEARRNGAKLVVIDPYKTRTARCADWYLPINPGTDVALALAMMHVIIRDGLYDADYVAKHTVGFEELRERVKEYPPAKVAPISGIAADDIEKLAREYATSRPAVIRVNYGVQRSENGGMAVRAITMLPCITGSWKEVGGGLQLSTGGSFSFNDKALERPDLMLKSPLGRPARIVNMSELGQALTALDNPPVKAVFVYNSNPVVVAPNYNDVVRGFLRSDMFTVVHEQFFTDTTAYADVLLPATTFFEHKDVNRAYGHYYLQVSNPAIEPLGECRPNAAMFADLAGRMGFTDDCFQQSIDSMIDEALWTGEAQPPVWMKGLTRTRLETEGAIRLNLGAGPFLPFAEGGFGTASGKAELYSKAMAAQGLDPVVVFKPPQESRHQPPARKFPLEMLSRKADNYLNSTFCNIASMQKLEQADLVEMNQADAGKRGIHDGDWVRVFNGRGEVRLKAHVNGSVQAGVVATRLTWAKSSPSGNSINALTSETLTDMGGGPAFYSCLVEIEPLSPSGDPGSASNQ